MSKASIAVEGFISNELEVKTTNSGKRVVTVTVPHTPQKKDGDQWVDAGPTTWFEASFWEDHVDAILGSVEKGTLVTLSGIPEVQAYVKRDGEPGAKITVQFPQLAKVVRRPPRSAPVASAPPASYDDETPF